jgi:hypothetical protein
MSVGKKKSQPITVVMPNRECLRAPFVVEPELKLETRFVEDGSTHAVFHFDYSLPRFKVDGIEIGIEDIPFQGIKYNIVAIDDRFDKLEEKVGSEALGKHEDLQQFISFLLWANLIHEEAHK